MQDQSLDLGKIQDQSLDCLCTDQAANMAGYHSDATAKKSCKQKSTVYTLHVSL